MVAFKYIVQKCVEFIIANFGIIALRGVSGSYFIDCPDPLFDVYGIIVKRVIVRSSLSDRLTHCLRRSIRMHGVFIGNIAPLNCVYRMHKLLRVFIFFGQLGWSDGGRADLRAFKALGKLLRKVASAFRRF